MYELFYGLNRPPFCLFYERDLFFESHTQFEAQEIISEFFSGKKNIISIQGPAGLGKTTVVRQLVDKNLIKNIYAQTYYLNCTINPNLSTSFIQEFNTRNPKQLQTKPNNTSIAKSISELKNDILLIIDDAQRLSNENISFLINLLEHSATNNPRFKLFLISNAKTEIDHEIEKNSILKNALTSCRLTPFSSIEVKKYIEYRLHHSGWKNNPSFNNAIFPYIYKLTGGIPRRINSLMDRLLTFAEFEHHKTIDIDILMKFCRYLHQELESQQTHDHDSSDLFISLGNNLQIFENNSASPKPKERQQKPANKELASIINLVINLHRHPERYKHLSDGLSPLPTGFNRLISYLSPNNVHFSNIQSHLEESFKLTDFKKLAHEFIIKTIFSPNANKYRLLGLKDKTELRDAKRNLNTLLSIINSNNTSTLLPANPKELLNLAYLSITNEENSNHKPVSPSNSPAKTTTDNIKTHSAVSQKKNSPSNHNPKQHQKNEAQPAIEIQPVINEDTSLAQKEENIPPFVSTKKISAIAASIAAVGIIALITLNINENTPADEVRLSNNQPINSKPINTNETIQVAQNNAVQRAPTDTTKLKAAPETIKSNEAQTAKTNTPQQQTAPKNITPLPTKNITSASNLTPTEAPPLPKKNDAVKTFQDSKEDKPTLADKKQLLNELIAKLTRAYKTGNINNLSTLFVKNAVTNENLGRKEIISEYQKLFRTTRDRDMKITNLQWNIKNNTTTATGNFTISSFNKKSNELTKKSGELFIHAKDTNETPRLQAFIYNKVIDQSPVKPIVIATTKKDLTEKKLNSLIESFVTHYDQGDIKSFSALFTENATTNDSSNLSEITKSYQQLFSGTSERNIQFKNLSWEKKDDSVTGVGTFSLQLKNKKSNKELSVNGEIFIDTKLVNDQAKINALHYRYSLASNE